MGVRKHRNGYVVEFQQGGERIFKRCPPGVSKAQAEALEVKIRRELFDRDNLGKKEDITLHGAIGLWLANNHRKNQKQAVSEAKQWEAFTAGRLLKDAPEVATEALQLWTRPSLRKSLARSAHSPTATGTGYSTGRTTARAPIVKPATINRRLALLKAVCKWAWKQDLIRDNLSGRITMLKEAGAREVYLTKAQVRRLAYCADSPVREAILIAAYSGLRASELLALTGYSTHSDTIAVASINSKTAKPRQVPVAKPLMPHLSALPLGLSYWQLHAGFDAARKKAKMDHVRFHDLRHTCASWLINAGVDLYTVGRILGHSSTQTTARYAHLSDASLKAAMGKLR